MSEKESLQPRETIHDPLEILQAMALRLREQAQSLRGQADALDAEAITVEKQYDAFRKLMEDTYVERRTEIQAVLAPEKKELHPRIAAIYQYIKSAKNELDHYAIVSESTDFLALPSTSEFGNIPSSTEVSSIQEPSPDHIEEDLVYHVESLDQGKHIISELENIARQLTKIELAFDVYFPKKKYGSVSIETTHINGLSDLQNYDQLLQQYQHYQTQFNDLKEGSLSIVIDALDTDIHSQEEQIGTERESKNNLQKS